MQFVRDFFNKTGLLILFLLLLAIAAIAGEVNRPLRDGAARLLVPKFTPSSDDVLAKRYSDYRCEKDFDPFLHLVCKVRPREEIIRVGMAAEMDAHDEKYVQPTVRLLMDTLSVIAALLVIALIARFVVNSHLLLKGRLNVNLPEIFRGFFQFFSSRKAEMELMRYKRLFENGVITEEEFASKKRSLKSKIFP